MTQAAQLSPVSISLSTEVTTVECETCGRCVSLSTSDRGLLVAEVRAFLRLHGVCRQQPAR